ncbi:hypothetical protein M413DRAFT_61836 [Hebeloma cylindrosporum]|uniref:SprT-like domain-containing protein n=1 Tax=Hebeloma cylindrosporum TaxID=76867 RepID=A0A0C3CV02_HEBCY|nr:hypothetical protein M413DRAFT_61836 [Hebeloma cylindrosporum h7]
MAHLSESDEPPSARTPLRIRKKAVHKPPNKILDTPNNTVNEQPLASKTRQVRVPSPGSLDTPSTPLAQRPSVEKTPRTNTKKSRLQAELQRRQKYAQQIFTELNNSVFEKGLPENTKLDWSKRLRTTAGKAKYHRSRDGVTTTEIELAEKILDCDERIRNTLSHEMCHLATWVIDGKVTEHHGKLFKAWASRVMKIHPDIDVSIKHNYEISYPFEWECELCSKVYGRFSKSIQPDECVCGACKTGKLIPLFPTKRPATTNKLSRMAAARPQGKHNYSPRTGDMLTRY